MKHNGGQWQEIRVVTEEGRTGDSHRRALPRACTLRIRRRTGEHGVPALDDRNGARGTWIGSPARRSCRRYRAVTRGRGGSPPAPPDVATAPGIESPRLPSRADAPRRLSRARHSRGDRGSRADAAGVPTVLPACRRVRHSARLVSAAARAQRHRCRPVRGRSPHPCATTRRNSDDIHTARRRTSRSSGCPRSHSCSRCPS